MTELREVKQRIETTREIRKMTSALQMIASVKLHRHQREARGSNRYTDKLRDLLELVAPHVAALDHPLSRRPATDRSALIVFGADRGLCGSFNAELVRETTGFLQEHPGLRLIVYGRVVASRLASQRIPGMTTRKQPSGDAAARDVTAITDEVCGWFASEEISSVHLLYHRYESALSIHTVIEPLLPLASVPGGEGEQPAGPGALGLATVEPNPRLLAGWLIPEWLNRRVQNAFLNSLLSESAARQRSMSRASENAASMVDELTMQYRRLRQESITAEMLELSGGTLA